MTDQQGFPPKNAPVIQLWMLDDFFGFIVQRETGVWYTNQTAGHGCHHPLIEGFYVPLPIGLLIRAPDSLENFGAWGDEGDRYDAERVAVWLAARALDEIFEPAPDAGMPLKEAWIPVRVRAKLPARCERAWFAADEQFDDLRGRVGVLTYENSD